MDFSLENVYLKIGMSFSCKRRSYFNHFIHTEILSQFQTVDFLKTAE